MPHCSEPTERSRVLCEWAESHLAPSTQAYELLWDLAAQKHSPTLEELQRLSALVAVAFPDVPHAVREVWQRLQLAVEALVESSLDRPTQRQYAHEVFQSALREIDHALAHQASTVCEHD
jgi:hypothetical protein